MSCQHRASKSRALRKLDSQLSWCRQLAGNRVFSSQPVPDRRSTEVTFCAGNSCRHHLSACRDQVFPGSEPEVRDRLRCDSVRGLLTEISRHSIWLSNHASHTGCLAARSDAILTEQPAKPNIPGTDSFLLPRLFNWSCTSHTTEFFDVSRSLLAR